MISKLYVPAVSVPVLRLKKFSVTVPDATAASPVAPMAMESFVDPSNSNPSFRSAAEGQSARGITKSQRLNEGIGEAQITCRTHGYCGDAAGAIAGLQRSTIDHHTCSGQIHGTADSERARSRFHEIAARTGNGGGNHRQYAGGTRDVNRAIAFALITQIATQGIRSRSGVADATAIEVDGGRIA